MVATSRRRLAEFGEFLTNFSKYGSGIASASDVGESLRVLNRTMSINNELDAIVLEPDQCFVSKMLEELGLSDSKSAKTPRLKPDLETHLQTENRKTFQISAATLCRSCSMRAAYLARD